jgi:hypothetical protein
MAGSISADHPDVVHKRGQQPSHSAMITTISRSLAAAGQAADDRAQLGGNPGAFQRAAEDENRPDRDDRRDC